MTNVIIHVWGYGYFILPIICIFTLILIRKRWIYSIFTVTMSAVFAWMALQNIYYRAQFSDDVGGIALAMILFPGLYILIGIVFLIVGMIVLTLKKKRRIGEDTNVD